MTTPATNSTGCAVHTVTYGHAGDLPLLADIHTATSPTAQPSTASPRPVLLFFHGGSLVIGNRATMLPGWLIQPLVVERGWLFVSFDYRLLPEATLEDINDDLLAVEQFVLHKLSGELAKLQLPTADLTKVVVSGASAGGYCALQGGHLWKELKPKAVAAIYPMTFADPQWYMTARPEPAVSVAAVGGQPDEAVIDAMLENRGAPISDFPLGDYSHPRCWLARFLFRRGTYWQTAFGSNSLPADMPPAKQRLLPALNVSASIPPTVLLHGAADSTITSKESEAMAAALAAAGARQLYVPVEGKQHGFDFKQTPEIQAPQQTLIDFVLEHTK